MDKNPGEDAFEAILKAMEHLTGMKLTGQGEGQAEPDPVVSADGRKREEVVFRTAFDGLTKVFVRFLGDTTEMNELQRSIMAMALATRCMTATAHLAHEAWRADNIGSVFVHGTMDALYNGAAPCKAQKNAAVPVTGLDPADSDVVADILREMEKRGIKPELS